MIRVLLTLILAVSACAPREASLVQVAHLRHLTERVAVDGDSVDIIHIYADAPGYAWVDANGEGVACVDDAARAAVFYLRQAELTGDRSSLEHARPLLKFVMAMQSPDGTFLNFLRADRTKNVEGTTSVSSFGWWAGRAVWSLGAGCRMFRATDPAFADRMASAVERTFPHLDTLLRAYGHERVVSGMRVPDWLLYASGADATSELVLGLVEFQRANPQARVRSYIERLCEGMMIMQDGDVRTFPFGAHRSWETKWHAWGNSQTQALASAGRLLNDKRMIESAKREAEGFYSRLIVLGNMREMDLADTSGRREFEQIAYDIRPMALGLLRLQEATGEAKYGRMAGLAASWLFGNNAAGAVMYDPATGRGYDGLRSGAEINRNSGAESTIEALLTVLEVEHSPEAKPLLFHSKKTLRQTSSEITRLFVGKDGTIDAGLRIDLTRGTSTFLGPDEASAIGRSAL